MGSEWLFRASGYHSPASFHKDDGPGAGRCDRGIVADMPNTVPRVDQYVT